MSLEKLLAPACPSRRLRHRTSPFRVESVDEGSNGPWRNYVFSRPLVRLENCRTSKSFPSKNKSTSTNPDSGSQAQPRAHPVSARTTHHPNGHSMRSALLLALLAPLAAATSTPAPPTAPVPSPDATLFCPPTIDNRTPTGTLIGDQLLSKSSVAGTLTARPAATP
ncbi:hypothetical protein C8F04DRAFT_1275317 [Mycena alexandri]|uniref:Uncharacterized protein n=1 Tax=Mycena alexandri TaxID=1745969 RepID=A0AAD6S4R3_9AGAR|nr:hypothetical protein C8F04DRAFT_1275317 [Mycena alexandri]